MSISQRNIDIHSRAVAAINARMVPEELLAPHFRMENRVTAVAAETYNGASGMREWMSDLFENFRRGARYEVEEIIADGEDYVVATVRLVGHSVRSGRPLELRWATVAWFHDGKATRVVGYTSPHEAMQAVGLE